MECDICGDPGHSAWNHRIDPSPAPDQAGLLPQHCRCRTCKQVTLTWDSQPCGSHLIPGAVLPPGPPPPVTPPRERTRDLAALARQQAAEARAARGDDLDAFFRRAAASTPHPTAAPGPPGDPRPS